MGFSFKNFIAGIGIVPKSVSSSSKMGDIEVLSGTTKASYHNGTSISPIVTEAHAATLILKTIDADLNTITNIENADIKPGAAIAYSKLNLTDSIVNADINSAAAIAYSKLNLTGSIVNADVSASAAISRAKLAAGSANHVIINDGTGLLSSEAQLNPTRGGTGLGTYAVGDLLYASSISALSRLAAGSNGQVLTLNTGLPSWQAAPTPVRSVVTTTTNLAISTANDVVLGNVIISAITITLPTAIGNSGKEFDFKKIDGTFSAMTIAPTGGQLIDGFVNYSLVTQFETLTIISDGSGWQILEHRIDQTPKAYTLVITGTVSNPTPGADNGHVTTQYRDGSYLHQHIDLNYSAGGSLGSGLYLFPIPTGLTADPNNIKTASADAEGYCGTGQIFDGTTSRNVQALMYDSTHFSLKILTNTNNLTKNYADIGSANFGLTNAFILSLDVKIPIIGWNG